MSTTQPIFRLDAEICNECGPIKSTPTLDDDIKQVVLWSGARRVANSFMQECPAHECLLSTDHGECNTASVLDRLSFAV